MITVNRGYILDQHPPAEYEYRFQSVPSGIMRSTEQPVLVQPEEDEAPALRLTTGDKIYLTSDESELLFNATSLTFISHTSGGPVTHVLSSELNSLTGVYRLTLDGSSATWSVSGTEPLKLALMTARAETGYYGGVYTYEPRLFVKYLNWEGYNIQEAPTLRPSDFGNWIKSQEMLIETAAVQQQEYLYTVTGGVVPTGGE